MTMKTDEESVESPISSLIYHIVFLKLQFQIVYKIMRLTKTDSVQMDVKFSEK